MPKPSFCIIGAGVVGTAFACVLNSNGYVFTGVFSRSKSSAAACQNLVGSGVLSSDPKSLIENSTLVFITVPDSSIEHVCRELSELSVFTEEKIVIHTSGVLSSDALASARDFGASVYSVHPIQSFADVNQAIKNLPGSFFGVEGKGVFGNVIDTLVKDLGGIKISIDTDGKVLYHAAAVAASNYLVTLLDLACGLMEKSGVSKEDTFQILKPLIYGSLNNIENVGIPNALTGPISRGDVITIEKHVQGMEQMFTDALPLYKRLGEYTVKIARAKGNIAEEDALEIEKILE